jgi:hypothetical protein
MPRTIGIDFGTSTTVVCYRDREIGQHPQPPVFLNFQGTGQLLKTIAYRPRHPDNGRMLFGEEALSAAGNEYQEDSILRSFKMHLLSEGNARDRAQECMQELFKFLYQKYADQTQGDQVDEVETWVSYPAKWPDVLREATKEAAMAAGFPNVQGTHEPSAAMQFYLHAGLNTVQQVAGEAPLTVMVVDLGAGTTDIVLFKATPGHPEGHEILSVWPTVEGASLGGNDLDQLLLTYFNVWIARHRRDGVPDGAFETQAERLDRIAQHKERSISPRLGEGLVVRRFDLLDQYRNAGLLRDDTPPYRMDRQLLGTIIHPHLRDFIRLVNDAVSDAIQRGRIGSEQEIELVILTGGHRKWLLMAWGKTQTQAAASHCPR